MLAPTMRPATCPAGPSELTEEAVDTRRPTTSGQGAPTLRSDIAARARHSLEISPNNGAQTMSEERQSTDPDSMAPQRVDLAAAFAAQPASFWLASLGSLGMIIGGIGPWATAFGYVSLSGTSMHGWRAVAVGVVALAMLGMHQLRRARLPLIVAGGAGVLAVMQAIATLSQINSNGAVTVLGQQYRYVDPAWGLYLVLGGAIVLVCSACALVWRSSRATG